MALVLCLECQNRISSDATVCPSCGSVTPAGRDAATAKESSQLALFLLVAIAACFLILPVGAFLLVTGVVWGISFTFRCTMRAVREGRSKRGAGHGYRRAADRGRRRG